MSDISVRGVGSSIITIEPLTDLAREWIDEHIGPDNGYQPYYPKIVVEPRYLDDILEGMVNDGLEI